ncbi:MAG: T9SS type A sorting domain-containing protein [Chitinophagaceae bacterium]|nr:T9SS type A sorting domain-containing protein [Chitinophagaceae bacterium]
MPVNLKTFKASAETDKKVKIFWTTQYEKDNSHFEIDRSIDGVNFTKVAEIPGKNLNGNLTDYVYYDQQALDGISFYRLKQVDVDLRYSYSAIERVKNAVSANIVDVYPNPAPSKEFKISLSKNVEGSVEVTLYDLSGRLVMKQSFANHNTWTVHHQLSPGMYTLKISGKEIAELKTLVVQ